MDADVGGTVGDQIAGLLDRVDPIEGAIGRLIATQVAWGSIEIVRHVDDPDRRGRGDHDPWFVGEAPRPAPASRLSLGLPVLRRLVDLGLSLDVDEYG